MDELLKRFYAQDASIRKLPNGDQVRLFDEWARRENLQVVLSFEEPSLPTWIRWSLISLMMTYIISFVVDGLSWARYLSPILVIVMSLDLWMRQTRPRIRAAQQVGDGQARSRLELIDFRDSNP